MLIYRTLDTKDLLEFRTLRRLALEEMPAAFAESAEEFRQQTDAHLALKMSRGPGCIFGAFSDGKLCGSAGLFIDSKEKRSHSGQIWGVYVLPECRRSGVAKKLIELIIVASQERGLLQLLIAVESNNLPAFRLYEKLGFEQYGLEPRALKVGSEFFDERLMVLHFRASSA